VDPPALDVDTDQLVRRQVPSWSFAEQVAIVQRDVDPWRDSIQICEHEVI